MAWLVQCWFSNFFRFKEISLFLIQQNSIFAMLFERIIQYICNSNGKKCRAYLIAFVTFSTDLFRCWLWLLSLNISTFIINLHSFDQSSEFFLQYAMQYVLHTVYHFPYSISCWNYIGLFTFQFTIPFFFDTFSISFKTHTVFDHLRKSEMSWLLRQHHRKNEPIPL